MSHPCPSWYRIMFTNAKTHLVPGSLRQDLLSDMAARDCLPNTSFVHYGDEWAPIRRVQSYGLDTSGMCRVDEPFVKTKIDNLPLEFPCTGVRGFLDQVVHLAAKGARRFASDRPYYKVHGNMHCMTLTPRQFDRLLVSLTKLVDEAETTARVFFADKISPIEVLRNVQAEAKGVAPDELGPVHTFGSSTADAYLPPVRGKA